MKDVELESTGRQVATGIRKQSDIVLDNSNTIL
jgi:hypothetical protein